MKSSLSIGFLFCCLGFLVLSCTPVQTKNIDTTKADTTSSQKKTTPPSKTITPQSIRSITDPRDGETYTTVTIGKQTWLAENLRYNAPGSMLNPDNPSKFYGRLYPLLAAQTACPKGWHLPSDREWDEVEMAHGMPASFIGEGGWRGEHATQMKSTSGWEHIKKDLLDYSNLILDKKEVNGTNNWGFNVLPAGYYFSGKMGSETIGMQGIGYSAAFWSSIENNIGCARFMFSPRQFVNKWEDKNNDSEAALSCRCVMN